MDVAQSSASPTSGRRFLGVYVGGTVADLVFFIAEGTFLSATVPSKLAPPDLATFPGIDEHEHAYGAVCESAKATNSTVDVFGARSTACCGLTVPARHAEANSSWTQILNPKGARHEHGTFINRHASESGVAWPYRQLGPLAERPRHAKPDHPGRRTSWRQHG